MSSESSFLCYSVKSKSADSRPFGANRQLTEVNAEKPTQSNQSNIAENIVIWNLNKAEGEDDDPTVTIHTVNQLIRDGLKIADVIVKAATRKPPGPGSINSGVVIATLDSAQSKQKVMNAKSDLKSRPDYANIYINNELSKETLTSQNNMRKLLKELGKEKDFKFHNGFMHKK